MQAVVKAEKKAKPKRIWESLKKEMRKHWMLYLMVAPAVFALFIFNYLPMAGLVMAFQKLDFKKGIFTSPWVGLDNFKFLFSTSDAWIITRNTVCYNVTFIVLNLVLSVGLALIMNELTCKRHSKVLQTMYIMPHFLSTVVISTIVYAFLSPMDGLVNSIIEANGGNQVNWYAQKAVWPFLLVLVYLWKSVGYSSVVYMATISGISAEYYEAAALDGASKWQQVKYITIPHMRTIICINTIMAIGKIFRGDFGLFYTVPRDSGMLYSVTDVLDTYIYRGLKTLNNPGMSTAAGLYQSVVGFVLVLIANKIVSKIDSDSAMF